MNESAFQPDTPASHRRSTAASPAAGRGRVIAIAFAAALATVGLIWLPIGTTMLGLIEEWDLLAMFTTKGVFFVTSLDSPLPALALRPLNIAPQALAYTLDPHSFLAWHALLAISLAAKALAMAYIVWWTLRDRTVAVLGGLLFVLYPADTMQMTLRAMHIDCAVAATLGGIALILAATETRRRLLRWSLALSGAGSFLIGSLAYEAGLPMAVAPVILWWARLGLLPGVRALRRQLVPWLTWSAAIAAAVGYVVVISRHGGLYQQSIGTAPVSLASLQHQFMLLFEIGLYREFADCWYDAARIFAQSQRFWPYVPLLFLIVAGVVLTLQPGGGVERKRGWGVWRLLLAGFLLACVGYAPYLSSQAHTLITQRTHLYAAIGGALAITALLVVVAGRRPVALVACWAVMLALGMSAQWNQLDHYTTLSSRARTMLAGILQAAPDVPADGHFLIIDQSGQLESTWMMRGGILGNALTYLYGHAVLPMVCVEPSLTWSSFVVDAVGRRGRCIEHATDWEIGADGPGDFTWTKQDLLVLTVAPDGTVQRTNEGVPAAVLPAQAQRWSGILGCWPAAACVYSPPLRPSYSFDFGQWWSLEDVPWGAGWRDAEWTPPAWQPLSFSWLDAPKSRLWVPLAPTADRYRLRLGVYLPISPEAQASLAIMINGQKLPLVWSASTRVEAPVPPGALKRGLNDVVFSSTLNPNYGISVAVDWVSIAPD